MTERSWRRVNIGLLMTIIVVNLYTIALPTLPSVSYWWRARHAKNQVTATVKEYVQQTQPQPEPSADGTETPAVAQPDMSGNRLIIPRMLMNTPIIEGPESNPYGNLKKGAWHLPFSSAPDRGGNMVIAGHRFTYTESRSIFYYLDKLQVGDEIGVKWHDVMYTYKVESSSVVEPTETSVEQPTSDTRLTLYTCTPLWNPKQRLVIVAKPIEGSN